MKSGKADCKEERTQDLQPESLMEGVTRSLSPEFPRASGRQGRGPGAHPGSTGKIKGAGEGDHTATIKTI